MKQKLRFILMTLLCAVFSSAWGLSDLSTTYTSNVTLSTTGGTQASSCKVKIDDTEYDGIKLGTNKNAGAWKVKVPANTKRLHLHLAAWNEEKVTLTCTPTGYSGNISLTANSGIASSSPFTFSGDPSSENYYKVITFANALVSETELTFTATSGKRFVVFGVNAEEGSGTPTITTPTFSPKAGYYVDQKSVTISCATDGASIYYTTNGNDPTTSSTNYTAPINVSATTTIKAIAVKGNEKSPVASATYTFLNVACESLTELSAMTETDRYLVDPLDAWVTYVNGKYAYIEDTSGGAIVLEKEGHGLTAGQTIKGPVAVDFQLNNDGNPQITDIDLTDSDCKVEDGNAPNPLPVVVSGWDYDFSSILNKYLKITDATITKEGTNYYVQLGENKVQLFGRGDASSISIPDLTDNDTYTIVGFPTMVNNTKGLVIFVQPLSNTASLPFEFDGGITDINITAGLTQQGLGDYNASPLLKFDSTGDELVLKINERPGKLTFDIKGNSFSGGTFSLQVSADGKTYTNVKSYTSLNTTTQSETVNNLDANARYIKWIYTQKASGNVALGKIKLEKFTGLDPELSFEAAEYTAILGKEFTTPTLSNPHNLTVTYSSSNEEVATVDAATGAVTLVKAGETTITATSEANETYKSGSAFYKLTVIQPLDNIAALSSQKDGGSYIVKFNNVVVTYVNGRYAYMQDASGAIVMYKSSHELTAGQVLNGTAEVTFQLYNGNPQITSLSGVTSTDGTAPEPTTVAASAWSTPIASVLSQYFKVTGATITKDGTKYYVQLGNENVQLYMPNGSISVTNLEKNTIIGFPTLNVKDDITTPVLQIFIQPEPEGIPSINAKSSIELAYNATSGEIAYTINNPVDDKSLQATADAGWISDITVTGEKVTFTTTVNDGEADRKGTITLTYEGAKDVKVEVTQKSPDFATLPFAFNGGKAAIEETTGLTQQGLGKDYSTSPLLKFDGTEDYLILKINERPGKLTFDIKGNDFSGGTFKVQTSENGETYTDLQTYTKFGDNGNDKLSEEFENLGENVRYIKWIYTEKVSGNVGLGNITLAKFTGLNPEISFEETNFAVTYGEPFTAPTLSNPHNVTVTYSSDNEDVARVNPETGEVTLKGVEGTVKITATSIKDETYRVGEASYTIAVTVIQMDNDDVFELVSTNDLAAGDKIIIVNVKETTTPANEETGTEATTQYSYMGLGVQTKNNRAAVEVNANNDGTLKGNNKLQVINLEVATKTNAETNEVTKTDNWWLNVGNGYLYAAGDSDGNYLRTEETPDANGRADAAITITEEIAGIVFQTNATDRKNLKYNSSNKIFSCYVSDQDPVKIYRKKGIPGDANNDGIVSVADVMLAVNYVLGNNPANFSFKNANVNNDDRITVADVMAIVKIVLGN